MTAPGTPLRKRRGPRRRPPVPGSWLEPQRGRPRRTQTGVGPECVHIPEHQGVARQGKRDRNDDEGVRRFGAPELAADRVDDQNTRALRGKESVTGTTTK